MILTDDNFATIVAAVEGGRGIYDNLMKYVRVQLVMLGGFILTFVGAGIFDIAERRTAHSAADPLDQLRVDVLLAIGLGFDAAVPGLMRRAPRDASAPIVDRALGVRLAIAGLIMAALALAVVAWGEERYDLVVATTMGLTTLSLMHVVAALEAREPTGTIFSRYTIANRRFVQLIGAGARTHVPRHRAPAAAADLRHGLADELAVGDLPARPDRLPRRCGARQARRPAHRAAPTCACARRDVGTTDGSTVDPVD